MENGEWRMKINRTKKNAAPIILPMQEASHPFANSPFSFFNSPFSILHSPFNMGASPLPSVGRSGFPLQVLAPSAALRSFRAIRCNPRASLRSKARASPFAPAAQTRREGDAGGRRRKALRLYARAIFNYQLSIINLIEERFSQKQRAPKFP
jgi:hypothetical protein